MDQHLESRFNVTPEEILDKADVLIDESQMQAGFDRMAAEISTDMAGLNPVVLCLMMGGLIPTAEVIKRLKFPLEIDYLHATRYKGDTQAGTLMWKVSPGIDLTDRHVLIVDDILDEGETLEAVLDAISAQGPASIRTAMMLLKKHNRRSPELHADYVGFEIADRYLFGCGLDYKDYFRQYPQIYAVAPEHLQG